MNVVGQRVTIPNSPSHAGSVFEIAEVVGEGDAAFVRLQDVGTGKILPNWWKVEDLGPAPTETDAALWAQRHHLSLAAARRDLAASPALWRGLQAERRISSLSQQVETLSATLGHPADAAASRFAARVADLIRSGRRTADAIQTATEGDRAGAEAYAARVQAERRHARPGSARTITIEASHTLNTLAEERAGDKGISLAVAAREVSVERPDLVHARGRELRGVPTETVSLNTVSCELSTLALRRAAERGLTLMQAVREVTTERQDLATKYHGEVRGVR